MMKHEDYYPAKLREQIEAYNATATAIEADAASVDARLSELRHVASVTANNAADRLKAVAKIKTERLAVAARRRDAAIEGAGIVEAVLKADNVERARLADAGRAREKVLRQGLADLGTTDSLTCARALAADKEIMAIRGAAANIGGIGRIRLKEAAEAARKEAEAEIGVLLE